MGEYLEIRVLLYSTFLFRDRQPMQAQQPERRERFMHRSKRCIIGINVALALIIILALDKAASLFAAGCTGGCTASFTIGNGTLVTESDNGATVNNGTPVTLNGLDLRVPVSLPITVTDASGSGHGWKLQIEATQFANSVATPAVALTGSYMAV